MTSQRDPHVPEPHVPAPHVAAPQAPAAHAPAPHARAPRVPEPHVLELRVHGVANTPPATMLGLEPAQIVRAAGDVGGSFWTPSPQVLAELTAAPPEDLPDDHRVPPPGVRREAYSWGALARLSAVPGWSTVSGALHAVIRGLWVLIIPFGLVNAAYWARRLEDGGPEPAGAARWATTPGTAGLVRLFGLLLTLLWTATAVTVTVGIVGAQCFVRPTAAAAAAAAGDGIRFVQVCDALPGALDGLARWTTGQRIALLGLGALGVVLALALVAATGTVRFDRRVSPARAREVRAGQVTGDRPPGAPVLTQPGLWSHARDSWLMWALHLAAAMSLITLVLAWQAVAERTGGWWWWALLVVPAAVIAAVAVRVATARTPVLRAGDRRAGWHAPAVVWTAVGLSLVLLLACLVLVAVSGEMLAAGAGQVWLPVALEHLVPALVAALTLLVVAGAAARTVLPWWSTGVLVVAALAAGLAAAGPTSDPTGARVPAVLAALAVVALVAIVTVAPPARGTQPVHEAWRGRAVAVFLALAAGFALLLTAGVVAATVAWLRAVPAAQPFAVPADAAERLAALDGDPLRVPVVTAVDGTTPAEVWTPPGFDGFAVTSLLALALLVGTVAIRAGRTFLWRRRPVPGPGGPDPDGADSRVQHVRRLATLTHRAEPVVGILAVALWLAMAGSLFVHPFAVSAGAPAPDHGWAVVALPLVVRDLSTAVVLVAVALLVASVGLGGGNVAAGRPWGLLWDLTCLLPRVAHPFAAPSYAERVVPELRSRIDEWLGVDPGAQDRADARVAALTDGIVQEPRRARAAARLTADRERRVARRRVVVSAHSLGAAVAVAALFARWAPPPPGEPRGGYQRGDDIALLTYGTQLRSHFGRFFPELFGPDVLGTEPSTGPRLWSDDPWVDDLAAPLQQTRRRGSLVDLLTDAPDGRGPAVGRVGDAAGVGVTGGVGGADGVHGAEGTRPRWRSLWRRTDYLGFPVDCYRPTPRGIDHPEAEIDDTAYLFTVATHGGDVRTPQYRTQLAELLRGWQIPPPVDDDDRDA